VTDASGAAVPDAAIEAKNVNTGATQNGKSDGQGRYRLSELGVGSYEVQVAKTGFSTIVCGGITLNVDAENVIDSKLLHPASARHVWQSGEEYGPRAALQRGSSLLSQKNVT
jgi:hypothetical protein